MSGGRLISLTFPVRRQGAIGAEALMQIDFNPDGRASCVRMLPTEWEVPARWTRAAEHLTVFLAQLSAGAGIRSLPELVTDGVRPAPEEAAFTQDDLAALAELKNAVAEIERREGVAIREAFTAARVC